MKRVSMVGPCGPHSAGLCLQLRLQDHFPLPWSNSILGNSWIRVKLSWVPNNKDMCLKYINGPIVVYCVCSNYKLVTSGMIVIGNRFFNCGVYRVLLSFEIWYEILINLHNSVYCAVFMLLKGNDPKVMMYFTLLQISSGLIFIIVNWNSH